MNIKLKFIPSVVEVVEKEESAAAQQSTQIVWLRREQVTLGRRVLFAQESFMNKFLLDINMVF